MAATDRPGAILALLAVHAFAALLAGPLFKLFGKRAFLALGIAPAALFAWTLTAAPGVVGGTPAVELLEWVPSLHFELSVRVDSFSLLMLTLVSGVGTLVFAYASFYFSDREDLPRMGGLLVAFSGAMAGLVVVDNLLALFLFWELTSITSYLLIGTDDRSATARAAALRALVTTGAGGLAMLGGFVVLAQRGGTWSMTELLADPPTGAAVNLALVLVLIGAFTKSAQFPFHYWLPGAMVAPTPVSAYLHSATMVKAGVYLIARFAPAFADYGLWRPVVLSIGFATMLLGGWRALSQTDLKVLLAHGTTSQLGFMVVLFGLGTPGATLAGATLLLAHGMFKAALFMVVGIVDKQARTRDIRRLDRLWGAMPLTVAAGAISAASMAGLPPLLGFIAKEGALESLLHFEGGASTAMVAGVVVGSILTFAYSARFVWGLIGPETPGVQPGKGEILDPVEAGPAILAPVAVLCAVTVVGGIFPRSVSSLVSGAAKALDGGVSATLALWHGFTMPLLLSVLIIVGGAALWVLRAEVADFQGRLPHMASGGRIFDVGLARFLRASDVVIGHVQTGSLPSYLMTIMATALLLPGVILALGSRPDLTVKIMDRPGQIVTVVLMAIASLGAVTLRHRMGAVLCVGAVGYGIAVLFMFQGAPDLALTQMMVETLVLVVFVMVMRHLPLRFARNQTAFAVFPRALLSVLVGAAAAVFVLIAFSARPADIEPVSQTYIEESPAAGGANIVNAILVEFRAFDTLGETTVLTVVALGVLGLVRAVKRERRGDAAQRVAPLRPSFVLDSAVQALFRTLILLSWVLLFSGHDDPGGGFIAGLVAGSAFMLVNLAGGNRSLRQRGPAAAETFLGIGVTIAVLAGAVGWMIGGEFLQSAYLSADVPVIGELKLSTTMVFDAGVYLVVVGLIMALLRSLGTEEVQEL
ncbi:MAG TPA: hydrogen gas-evolving membrane-bound hydrogenase subunit E [Microthrixaceae bacterium]|nr:hydrogen gas-evolving membrane-bound hydrogenase subunit E [Microthrixaceae bacterium]